MAMKRAVKQVLSISTLMSVSLASLPAQAGHWESTLHPQINVAQIIANPLTTGGFAAVTGLDVNVDGLNAAAINTIAGAYAGNPTNVPVGGQGVDVGYSGFDFNYHWVPNPSIPLDYAPAFGFRYGKSWVAVAGAGLASGGSASASATGLPAAAYQGQSTPEGVSSISADPANASTGAWNYLWGLPPKAISLPVKASSVAQLIAGGRIGYSLPDTAIDVAHEMEWYEIWYPQQLQIRDGIPVPDGSYGGYNQAVSLSTVSLRTGTAVDGFNDATFMHQFVMQGFPLP